MYDSINERIKYYRNQKKLSQTELGAKLGLKCSTYSQMERQGSISVPMALDIAKFLEVNPDLIIYGYEKNQPIEITVTKPQTIIAGEKTPFIENYAKPAVEIKEEKVGNTLSATEEGIIEIYRSLPKDKQKELFNFINAMR